MKYEVLGNDKQSDLNLYICGKDENLTPGIKYGPVIRDSYIIESCTGGYGSVIINGTEFPVSDGDCVILLPGDVIIHTADDNKPRCGVWCAVKGIKIASYLKLAGITSKTPYAPKEAFHAVTKQIEKLIDMEDDNDIGSDLRREAHIHFLFGEILRHVKKGSENNLYTQKALHIIEMRYGDNLSIASIADELGLERCYFSTIFKQSTGKTPHSYLSELRIKKACALLTDCTLSVSEVAQAVGIEPVNFSRVFKKYTGMLPTNYKKDYRV